MIATAAAPRSNEQKIRRHDVNEGVGFGFVIIEYWYVIARRGGFSYLVCKSTTETTLLNQSALSCQHQKRRSANRQWRRYVYLIERAVSKELAPKANLATLNDGPTIRVSAWIAELAPPFNCRPFLKERNSSSRLPLLLTFNLFSGPRMWCRPEP